MRLPVILDLEIEVQKDNLPAFDECGAEK